MVDIEELFRLMEEEDNNNNGDDDGWDYMYSGREQHRRRAMKHFGQSIWVIDDELMEAIFNLLERCREDFPNICQLKISIAGNRNVALNFLDSLLETYMDNPASLDLDIEDSMGLTRFPQNLTDLSLRINGDETASQETTRERKLHFI